MRRGVRRRSRSAAGSARGSSAANSDPRGRWNCCCAICALPLRGLLRNPGLTVVAVLTLALAIGANTTVFSLISQALLQALPVHDPQQLVVFSFAGSYDGHRHSEGGDKPGHSYEFSYPMIRDLGERNTALSGLIASSPVTVGATWNNRSEAVGAELVSGNYFNVLGVQPAAGRVFSASDETAPGANPVAVLNFDYWKTHLAEAPVVGRTLLIDAAPFTVVGVAAPGFHSVVWGRLPPTSMCRSPCSAPLSRIGITCATGARIGSTGGPVASRGDRRAGRRADEPALPRAAPSRNSPRCRTSRPAVREVICRCRASERGCGRARLLADRDGAHAADHPDGDGRDGAAGHAWPW